MFADPQTVTYAASSKSLPAISRGDSSSTYKLNENGVVYDLTMSHQFKARNRVNVRLRRDAYASDPLVPANSMLASMTASFTLDFPNVGYTAVDAQNLGNALVAYMTSANILKLANGET